MMNNKEDSRAANEEHFMQEQLLRLSQQFVAPPEHFFGRATVCGAAENLAPSCSL